MTKSRIFKTAVAAAACSMLFTACGDDSSSSNDPNGSGEIVSISDKAISGVSQKGPFVTGSTVTLYELDENFKQTGKSFTGDIASDDGAFKIDAVELASQYAFLKANGYYRNEVTGQKSSGTITLNALTDLRDREKVNVNLLTHLEYERAMYLVENDTLSVAEAKAQAEKEIFKAFAIEGDFDNSEDLDIFSKGEGNAALLAISILMQGDRSEADLTEFLKKFASDIKEDGTWDDEKSKVELADWALLAETNGKLDSIRKNIASWKLGEVPEFEKNVRAFWIGAYGLDACGEKNKGEVIRVPASASKFRKSDDVQLVCRENGWAPASYLEIDTYGLAEDAFKESVHPHYFEHGHGEARYSYVYDVVQKKWREAYDWEAPAEADNSLFITNLEYADSSKSNYMQIHAFLCEGESIGGYAAVAYKKVEKSFDGSVREGFFCGAGSVTSVKLDDSGRLAVNLCDSHIYKCTENGWEERKKAVFASEEEKPDFLEAATYYVKDYEPFDGLVVYVPQVLKWVTYDEELGWVLGSNLDGVDDSIAGCTVKKEGVVIFDGYFYKVCAESQPWMCTGGDCIYGDKQWTWHIAGRSEEETFGKKCQEETLNEEIERALGISETPTPHKYICTEEGWKKND